MCQSQMMAEHAVYMSYCSLQRKHCHIVVLKMCREIIPDLRTISAQRNWQRYSRLDNISWIFSWPSTENPFTKITQNQLHMITFTQISLATGTQLRHTAALKNFHKEATEKSTTLTYSTAHSEQNTVPADTRLAYNNGYRNWTSTNGRRDQRQDFPITPSCTWHWQKHWRNDNNSVVKWTLMKT